MAEKGAEQSLRRAQGQKRDTHELADLTFPVGIHSTHGSPMLEITIVMETPLSKLKPALVSSELCAQQGFSIYEVQELWYNDKTCRIGKGVSETIEHISKAIRPELMGKKLSGWNRRRVMNCHAESWLQSRGHQPVLVFSVICGSSHTGSELAVQEFLVLAVGPVT
ncbi:hypothetical protein HPG69_017730 [Diceros bicornis minor]|uniref:Uncharacterized protein n=1 Tax=Diceros bicornis minor TaxID=77932 RepID=A0A7J7FGS1_DICBM|nr:hypothetical protein HPG69_017730 [Diceros bicornis minor]